MRVPLFPLNTVVFPGGILPLRIFEPRYLDMVSQCLRNDTGFGVCLIRDGQEAGAPADIHPVGTLCRIVDWETLPDGLLGITAQGEHKLRVHELQVESNRLVMGEVEMVAEEPERPLHAPFEPLAELLRQVIEHIGAPYTKLPAFYGQAGWVSARLTELLPLSMTLKQRLLELGNPDARLAQLREALVQMQQSDTDSDESAE